MAPRRGDPLVGRFVGGVGLSVISVAAAAWAALTAVHLNARAGTECLVYNAGNRFALTFLDLPTLAGLTAIASVGLTMTLGYFGGRYLVAGWMSGMLVIAGASYMYLLRAGQYLAVRECMPPWWPNWLAPQTLVNPWSQRWRDLSYYFVYDFVPLVVLAMLAGAVAALVLWSRTRREPTRQSSWDLTHAPRIRGTDSSSPRN